MKKINLITLLFLFLLLGLNGCTKKKYLNTPLESEWLLPLIKGDITSLTITDLINKSLSIKISAADLGIAESVPQSNPVAATFYNVASYQVETNDLIKSINFDTCHLQLTVKNNFPVSIKQGTAISFRDAGTLALLKSFVFTTDVAKGGQELFDIDLSGRSIGNEIKITIDTLVIDAYENQVFKESLEFNFLFKTVSINSVDLFTNKDFKIDDIVEFDGSMLDIDENLNDSSVTGKLSFYCNNELPINAGFQIHFMDDNEISIDSIFTVIPAIKGGVYSGANFVSVQKTSFFTTITKERLRNIKSATKVRYSLNLNSNNYSGSSLHVDKKQMLSLKLIGDIKLVLNPIKF